MFLTAYLWGELRGRFRQTLATGSGLALGIGTVITITAIAAGVAGAEGRVLQSLYGVGTDITVTTPLHADSGHGFNGVTPSPHDQYTDVLASLTSGQIDVSRVAQIGRLTKVAAAAGALVLTESKFTIPGTDDFPPPAFKPPILVSVIGVDLSHAGMGPYSLGTVVAGRGFAVSDSTSSDAVLSSSYAADNGLSVGSLINIDGANFQVIGIVGQSQDSNPPDVYIPLSRAQALAHLTGFVNTIFVKAMSARDVDAVIAEIQSMMPTATVNSSRTLADQVSGSLATVAGLAATFGRWLSVIVLAAAVGTACLMTGAAVSRRARDFGTLKALGWRNARIIVQVLSESIVVGVVAAAIGVGIGLAGSAIVSRLAPDLSATVQEANTDTPANQPGASGGFFSGTVGGAMTTIANPNATHTVTIPFEPSVDGAVVEAAVVLAIAGGLVAGGFGGWRIARLRPAVALTRLE